MKKLLLHCIILMSISYAKAQSLYFPPTTGSTWDTVGIASLGWCQDEADSLIQFLDQNNSKAFILLKDGKIVIEHYFDNFTKDSLWYWASAGKTLTAFTVGMAQQEGYLSLDDSSSNYLGQGWTVCPTAKEGLITIRNQLTMTTGLNDGVPDHYCTLDTCLQYLADAGTRWAYHNGPYTMLDGVIANATGQSLNTYFMTKVRNPIGMNGAFFPSGYNNVYVSNARSMARFGLLMLNKGNWNGTQIMTDTTYFHDMVNTSQTLNNAYGYLWWLNGKSSFRVPTLQTVFNGSLHPDAPNDMFSALGKDGQIVNVVPSMNLVFIRMGEAPGTSSEVTFAFNNNMCQKMNAMICNVNPVSSSLAASVQVFPNPVGDLLTISTKNVEIEAVLMFNMNGQLVKQMNNVNANLQNISVAELPEAVYMLQIRTDKGVENRRVVVAK